MMFDIGSEFRFTSRLAFTVTSGHQASAWPLDQRSKDCTLYDLNLNRYRRCASKAHLQPEPWVFSIRWTLQCIEDKWMSSGDGDLSNSNLSKVNYDAWRLEGDLVNQPHFRDLLVLLLSYLLTTSGVRARRFNAVAFTLHHSSITNWYAFQVWLALLIPRSCW